MKIYRVGPGSNLCRIRLLMTQARNDASTNRAASSPLSVFVLYYPSILGFMLVLYCSHLSIVNLLYTSLTVLVFSANINKSIKRLPQSSYRYRMEIYTILQPRYVLFSSYS